jgi:type 1 glutamine amidotransferase
MSAGWQHDSVSDALATLYKLGKESGLWDTYIRTDTELVTKKALKANAKNLDYFHAVFFMTTGELPMDDQQKADLLAFIRDDGKGFLGAHNATDTFYKWPEFGEMIGGYFDGHPWGTFLAPIKVVDRTFVATSHFPESFQIMDEIYQTKNFDPSKVKVSMTLDTAKVDMKKQGVKYQEIPITWTKEYGKGRVFYCGLGHPPEAWGRPDIQKMWLEAVKWAMGITP